MFLYFNFNINSLTTNKFKKNFTFIINNNDIDLKNKIKKEINNELNNIVNIEMKTKKAYIENEDLLESNSEESNRDSIDLLIFFNIDYEK